ncbi:DUF4357 domain-containing protein, partial [bacterium]|nr:DUF4357 domain-containing protein [bacterium]
MEYFLGQLQLMLPVLGFTFLQPKPVATPPGRISDADESPLFLLGVVGVEARAREIDGEFIVMKGSTARREGTRTWTSCKGLREQLVDEGKLVLSDQPDYYVFTEDVSFSSPS